MALCISSAQSGNRTAGAHNPRRLKPKVNHGYRIRRKLRGGDVKDRLRAERGCPVDSLNLGYITDDADNSHCGAGLLRAVHQAEMTAYGIGLAKKITRKRFVHNRYRLARGRIRIAHTPPCQQRHPQSRKVSRGNVRRADFMDIACILPIHHAHRQIQTALVGYAQSHRRIFNAGNALHGGDTSAQQRLETRHLFVSRIIERCAGGHHIVCVKSRRQRLQMHQRAHQQSRRRYQHHRQRHFSADQHAANTPRILLQRNCCWRQSQFPNQSFARSKLAGPRRGDSLAAWPPL